MGTASIAVALPMHLLEQAGRRSGSAGASQKEYTLVDNYSPAIAAARGHGRGHGVPTIAHRVVPATISEKLVRAAQAESVEVPFDGVERFVSVPTAQRPHLALGSSGREALA